MEKEHIRNEFSKEVEGRNDLTEKTKVKRELILETNAQNLILDDWTIQIGELKQRMTKMEEQLNDSN